MGIILGNRLEQSGIEYISKYFFEIIISMLILLFSAGTIDIKPAWEYFFLNFFTSALFIGVLCIINPKVLNYRNEPFKHNTKKWDKIILIIYTPFDAIFINIVAGFDIGKYHWYEMPMIFFYLGLVLLIASSIILSFSMICNDYYEVTARIQFEKDQSVIEKGPYKIIRHPGYLSMMLNAFSMPLYIRSGVTLICSVIFVILLLIRTKLEDEMLIKELSGYKEYALRVRFRIIPLLW